MPAARRGKRSSTESIVAHVGFGGVATSLLQPCGSRSSRNTGSHLPPEPASTFSLEPGSPLNAHPAMGSHPAWCWGHQLPAGSRERTGSAIKSPRFPLFPLPRQLLPRSAGWGSGICHGKQRAGNKFPNCRMLTDTHVTSVRIWL